MLGMIRSTYAADIKLCREKKKHHPQHDAALILGVASVEFPLHTFFLAIAHIEARCSKLSTQRGSPRAGAWRAQRDPSKRMAHG